MFGFAYSMFSYFAYCTKDQERKLSVTAKVMTSSLSSEIVSISMGVAALRWGTKPEAMTLLFAAFAGDAIIGVICGMPKKQRYVAERFEVDYT
jgi:hypothetical protein